MDVRTLQHFLTIAQEDSFTKAAECLHMTQPPLSRQMRSLEAHLFLV
ncbi:LysR family transcriptional regulator [Adlercreutzia murintestinalis]|nr:LysR family transcriptional regulator [Adlercreutzia murintestinalis]